MARRQLEGLQYVPNWLSPVGALAGALRFLDVPVPSPPYLTAISGHAFQFAFGMGVGGLMRAAAPTGERYRRAVGRYGTLGLRAELHVVPPGDLVAREAALGVIRRAIDRKRAVIAFGLHTPEYGLVIGYDEERGQLLVSTLTTEQQGAALPLAMWPPPGSIGPVPLVVLERHGRFEREAVERAALGFALEEAVAEPGEGELAVGIAAYERWQAELRAPEAALDGRGHAYTIQMLLAARREAGQFVAALVERAGGGTALREAGGAYQQEVLALSRLASMFSYPHGGDIMNAGVREQGARYLATALERERAALDAIRTMVT